MNIAVCLKQVLDPDIPASEFRLDGNSKTVSPANPSWVINIFDENALETALQLRDSIGGSKVTAISFGSERSIEGLRKALAMQADQAILISEEGAESVDTFGKAKILATALRQQGPFDLILCGRETADWHGARMGCFLSEELGLPCVSFVARISQQGDKLHLRRQTDTGWEVLQTTPPAVLTITNDDGNLPRIPKVRDSMKAFRKEIPTLTLESLELTSEQVQAASVLDLTDLFIPQSDQECLVVEGEDGPTKAKNLLSKMEELKII